MAYSEKEARKLVAEAGRRLKREGLTARTWGNLSARISDEQFVVTPSGLDYDAIEPEDLVTVRISDCAWEGERKPSSEKGIHADAYRLRPEVDFVIHTHQDQASVYGILGELLETGGEFPALGNLVPCAEYGLPSTKRLRRAVADQLEWYPEASAVLLRNHGALCMGKDCGEAFLVAKELERACGEWLSGFFGECGPEGHAFAPSQAQEFSGLGKSRRKGNRFCLLFNGDRKVYDLGKRPEELPLEAAIHGEIYRNSDACYIAAETSPAVTAFCSLGDALLPYLDDLAQIAGISVRFSGASPEKVKKALKGRNAVLIRGRGALCTGKTADDVAAVRMILRKGCEAGLLAKAWNEREEACLPLGEADARLQRLIYRKKYSKKKNRNQQ